MPNTLCLNVNFPLKKFSNSSFYRFLFLPTIWLNPFFHFLCRCYWWSSLYLSSAGVPGSPCLLRVPTYLKNVLRVPTYLKNALRVPTYLKNTLRVPTKYLLPEKYLLSTFYLKVPTKYLLPESILRVPTTQNTNLRFTLNLITWAPNDTKVHFPKRNRLINWEIGYPIL